jgi:hypothetical protein
VLWAAFRGSDELPHGFVGSVGSWCVLLHIGWVAVQILCRIGENAIVESGPLITSVSEMTPPKCPTVHRAS